MVRLSRSTTILLITLILSACGGGGGDTAATADAGPSITEFSVHNSDITQGESTELTAIFQGGTGTVDNGVGAISSGTPVSVSPTADTMYTLTVQDTNGQAVTRSVSVNVFPEPTVSSFVANRDLITNGDTASITAEFSGGTGELNNGIGKIESGVPVSVTPSVDTTYTLTVTNPAGRNTIDTLEVAVVAPPAIEGFHVSQPTIYVGEAANLVATFSGGIGRIDNGVGSVSSETPVSVTPTTSTTYTLTVSNAAGAAVTSQVAVTVDALPQPSISGFTANPNPITVGSTTQLLANFDGGAGSIDNGVGTVISGTPVSVSPSDSTTFTLSITNEFGVVSTRQTVVDVVPEPRIADFSASRDLVSQGESTVLTANFENGSGSIDQGIGPIASGEPIEVSPESDTQYTMTVTNAAGDSQSTSLTVRVVPQPEIQSFTVGQSAITNGDETTLLAIFSNGTGSIDNGIGTVVSGSSTTVSPSEDTTYALTVENEAGTTVQETLSVTVVPLPSIVEFRVSNPVITKGNAVVLTPVFEGGEGVIYGGGIGPVTSGVDATDVPVTNTEYELVVTNPAGATVSETVAVTVEGIFVDSHATMTDGRAIHTATLLDTGDVLVTGGYSPVMSSAEIFDPTTDVFSSVGSMSVARFFHTATKLPDGQVLIAGGISSSVPRAQSELFDAETSAFSAAAVLAEARYDHTATLLNDGRVLVAGGIGETGPANGLEVYDPSTDTYSTVASILAGRRAHTATLLKDGTVLIAGGYGGSTWHSSTERFDPSTGAISYAGSLSRNRQSHTATLLQDGRVLIAGGVSSTTGSRMFLDTAEIYDPKTDQFASVGLMNERRAFHQATLLENGKVLITGGTEAQTNSAYLDSAELFDPSTNSFSPTDTMSFARANHSATALPDGRTAIIGGNDCCTDGLPTVEYYQPVSPVEINWTDIGGPSSFGIQALTFEPVTVDSFIGLETDGYWYNGTGSTNSSLTLQIYLRINGTWTLFAEHTGVRGPYGSTFDLSGFEFLPIDLSGTSISGINFTNSIAGSGSYRRMDGTLLRFRAPE